MRLLRREERLRGVSWLKNGREPSLDRSKETEKYIFPVTVLATVRNAKVIPGVPHSDPTLGLWYRSFIPVNVSSEISSGNLSNFASEWMPSHVFLSQRGVDGNIMSCTTDGIMPDQNPFLTEQKPRSCDNPGLGENRELWKGQMQQESCANDFPQDIRASFCLSRGEDLDGILRVYVACTGPDGGSPYYVPVDSRQPRTDLTSPQDDCCQVSKQCQRGIEVKDAPHGLQCPFRAPPSQVSSNGHSAHCPPNQA